LTISIREIGSQVVDGDVVHQDEDVVIIGALDLDVGDGAGGAVHLQVDTGDAQQDVGEGMGVERLDLLRGDHGDVLCGLGGGMRRPVGGHRLAGGPVVQLERAHVLVVGPDT
jgi:hypothetical protein